MDIDIGFKIPTSFRFANHWHKGRWRQFRWRVKLDLNKLKGTELRLDIKKCIRNDDFASKRDRTI